MSSQLRIVRTTRIPDTFRAYRLIVDGKAAGVLFGKQELVVPLEAGRHTICARVDWCGSRTLVFDAKDDEEIVFRCGSALADWRLLITPVYITIRPDEYLWLEQSGSRQGLTPPLCFTAVSHG